MTTNKEHVYVLLARQDGRFRTLQSGVLTDDRELVYCFTYQVRMDGLLGSNDKGYPSFGTIEEALVIPVTFSW